MVKIDGNCGCGIGGFMSSNIVEIFNIEEPYTNGITKVEFSVLNKSQILISVF